MHETGHTLGIGHYSVNDSVMYACYNLHKNKNIDLNSDDTDAVQYLYGIPKTITSVTISTTSTENPPTRTENETNIELSEIKNS